MTPEEILAILEAPSTPSPPAPPPDPDARPEHACMVCSRNRWWQKPCRRWTCGICHPRPTGDSGADEPVLSPAPDLEVDLGTVTARDMWPTDSEEAAETWGALVAHRDQRPVPANAARWSRWWPRHIQMEVPLLPGRNDFDIMGAKARHAWAHYLDMPASIPLTIPGTTLTIHTKYGMVGPTMPWLKELPERNKGKGHCYTLTIPCRGWCKNQRRQSSVILVGWLGAEELASNGSTRIEGEGERAREVYGVPADDLHAPDALKTIVDRYRG